MGLLFIKLLIPLAKFTSLLPTVFSISTHQGATISKLVEFHMNHQLYPKTLRVIQYNTKKSPPSFDLLGSLPHHQYPVILGNNKPLIKSFDPRRISTGRMVGYIERYKYVVVIFINDETAFTDLMQNIIKTVNRRWEKVLIISESTEFLQKIMVHESTVDLKDKLLISLDNPKIIWADPLVYDGGKMIPVRYISEIPMKKKMGGNLHGRHLKVAGCEFRPWMYRTGKDSNGRHTFGGNHVKIVQVAGEKFNYTHEFSYDPSYGEFWPENKTWTGMYSRVYYPEQGFHFTLVLSYEYDWSYGVDYPSTINTCELMFLTNQPVTKLQWYSFLLPFQITVWVWIIAFFIFLTIVQFIVMYFYHDRKIKYIVLDSAIFLPYAMAMEQGLCEIPKGARYLALIWLLGCVVLGTGYKATLRDNMTFPTPEIIPMTFEELAERPDYKITLYTLGSLERAYIQGSNMPALINIRQRMQFEYNVERCLRNVYMTPYSVCMGWSSLIIQETARTLTVNTRVEPLVFSKNTPKLNIQSMAFQKDSIFVDSFFGITEAVYESGLVGKWEMEENLKFKKEGIARLNKEKDTDLYRLLIKQTKHDDSERGSLTMSNVWAIFLFLPLGSILGAIFFALEHYIWNEVAIDEYINHKLTRIRISLINFILKRNPDIVVQIKSPKIHDMESNTETRRTVEYYDPFGYMANTNKSNKNHSEINMTKSSRNRNARKGATPIQSANLRLLDK